MRRLNLIASFLISSTLAAAAQSPAFVPQPSGIPGATVGQAQGQRGGAFVQQLPADARPRVVRSTPAVTNHVPVQFIETRIVTSTEQEPLVVNEDEGIVSYGQAKRPKLPTIGSGASVIVTPPNAVRRLPDVADGAVLL